MDDGTIERWMDGWITDIWMIDGEMDGLMAWAVSSAPMTQLSPFMCITSLPLLLIVSHGEEIHSTCTVEVNNNQNRAD